MTLVIDGTLVRLTPLVAGMVRVLVHHQETIVRQRCGCLLIDYAANKAALKVLKKQYDVEIPLSDADKTPRPS